MLLQANCIEFKSQMWVSSLLLTLTDPASLKAAHHRSRLSVDSSWSTRQLLLHS